MISPRRQTDKHAVILKRDPKLKVLPPKINQTKHAKTAHVKMENQDSDPS